MAELAHVHDLHSLSRTQSRVSVLLAPIITGRWHRVGELFEFLLITVVYVVTAKLGFQAAFVAEQVSPVWPPSGLALWAVLYFGGRVWPAIWVGAFVANVTTDVPFVAACAIATGNTLEALVAMWLLRRYAGIDRVLESLRQVTGLIVAAAVVSTLVSATVGVMTLCLAGLQPWTRFSLLWWIWWLGDATGDLLVAPVLLTAPLWRRAREHVVPLSEALALGAITLALSVFVFVGRATPLGERLPLQFVVFPLVIWAGLRFAHPGAALVSALISLVAVWGTLHGAGPFGAASGSSQESVILLQIYTAVIATSGLVLGAAIADRNRSEQLREAEHTLTAILAEEHDLPSASRRILSAVCNTREWDVGIMWQADDDDEVLKYVDSWQRDHRTDDFVADSRVRLFRQGVGLPGRVWSSAQPAWIYDVVIDSNFPRSAVAARVGLHGGFAFPILLGQKVVGVIELFAPDPRRVDAELLTLMAAAGSQIGQFVDRKRAQARVVQSEALNVAIINAALDCVITIDATGRILEFNPAAVLTFGFSRDQAVGQELAATLVPDRLRERHRAALRRCVETGEGPILGKRIEMPALRADGTEFPIELAITRVGSIERPAFTAHIRDITDLIRMDAERSELLERERTARLQAEHANRAKDQFLATVSHELRTPLTAILGWAAMLQTREFDPGRVQQIYDSVFRNAQAQRQIVDDLLDVSRIVTGQLRLELEPTDVCEVVRLSLETSRPTAIAKGVGLESDIPSSTCVVSGDPARLQQVVWNLLSNAIKFTPVGGTVTLAVRHSGPNVIIEVRDTGMGVPAAFLSHLFERFWQADSTTTRAHGGLGLGLALVRHIVELHGGDVHAASAGEGGGSTFTVTLPRARNAMPRAPSLSLVGATREVPLDITVLAVDDDPEARQLFAAVLGTRGCRVVCAASAAEGLEMFKRRQPQVMTIDIGMSGEDGFMLLQQIRAHEAAHGLRPTPAIAVTAYAGIKARKEVLEAGFAAHVPKPVLPGDLLAEIARVIGEG